MIKLKITPLILLFYLNNSATSCSSTALKKAAGLKPYAETYNDGDTTQVTCSANYIIGWATDISVTAGNLVCEGGTWKKQDDPDYAGISGCVACIPGVVDCTDGTCNDQGDCDCREDYKKSSDNPRLCTEKTCPLGLSNSAADIAGPYTDGTVVTVTCTEGYHVTGAETKTTEQISTCKDEAFTPLVQDCEVCSSNDDCIDGTCTVNGACECDESAGYKPAEGSPNVCELVECDDNYCQNNGVCSNGGTCARDLSNADDVTNFVCQCAEEFEGDLCQFAKEFHFSTSSTGVKISKESGVESAEIHVKMAAGTSHMYIALIKGIDMSDNDIKVVLKKVDDETLELSVSKQIQLLPTSTDQAVGLTLATGTTANLRLYKDSSSKKIRLDVDDVTVVTSTQTVKLFTEFWFGGSPDGCGWNQEGCPAGDSRIFYTSFVGSFLGVKLGDQRVAFSELGDNKVPVSMGCTDYTCANSGSCSHSTGHIVCSCPQGFSGLHCDHFSGISFNGYTSNVQSNLRTVPIDSNLQTIHIEISKSEHEVGEILRLNVGTQSCDLSLSAAGGNRYTIQDKTVTVEDLSLVITFDGVNAYIGDVGVSCRWDFSSPTSTLLYKLGGSSTKNRRRKRSTTVQNKSFQGCVNKLALNGVDLLQQGEISELDNIVTDKCQLDLLPTDPCLGDPCPLGWSCSVDAADYSAVCTYTCSAGLHTCSTNGQCTSLRNKEECMSQFGVQKCSVRWYYQCLCNEGWEGDDCQTPSSQDEETGSSSEVMDTTTIIILIVVLLVVVVLGVVIVFIVKKQKISPASFLIDGKDRGWFNPGPLANDEEEGRQSRDPAIQLAGQRAVKLNYTPPKT
ncbi:hypothetical protein ACHWQZ_G016947 [Mnemiopsis leidyi]